jgi:hypothetical protein
MHRQYISQNSNLYIDNMWQVDKIGKKILILKQQKNETLKKSKNSVFFNFCQF